MSVEKHLVLLVFWCEDWSIKEFLTFRTLYNHLYDANIAVRCSKSCEQYIEVACDISIMCVLYALFWRDTKRKLLSKDVVVESSFYSICMRNSHYIHILSSRLYFYIEGWIYWSLLKSKSLGNIKCKRKKEQVTMLVCQRP